MTYITNGVRRCYGTPLPHLNLGALKGKLIVIEGGDGSGRSTQVKMLRDWFEEEGHPVVEVGLKRSSLVGLELQAVMRGNTLNPLTLFLYYATDFADQLENVIVPALRSGFVVLADRYIYTLLARDLVRGADPNWIRDLYSFALIPDAVFYLAVAPATLAERELHKNSSLDYWESGMDIRRSGDMYDCFISYQSEVKQVFEALKDEYGFILIDGDRHPHEIFRDLRRKVSAIIQNPRKEEGQS